VGGEGGYCYEKMTVTEALIYIAVFLLGFVSFPLMLRLSGVIITHSRWDDER
jgi:hypothetical protein